MRMFKSGSRMVRYEQLFVRKEIQKIGVMFQSEYSSHMPVV